MIVVWIREVIVVVMLSGCVCAGSWWWFSHVHRSLDGAGG